MIYVFIASASSKLLTTKTFLLFFSPSMFGKKGVAPVDKTSLS
jgi:hypothetical protein